ncbi:hypothetical protein HTZ97_08500 [Desulfuromonas acetoxidans]|uniref:VCBS repeat-containing protein n=1 Tax=Desulfuromonas acetoxidans (strain DSM 684 / 11070) TaxID=281689 RepID=Q1K0J5_DESA6|nr:hypothetical protein [Desulfuromonas acetoxidans]EAT15946.1 conserved hypothetical protein [Desulfuromonas acetoxidans DSM 684]MBF0644156.1 hypothetical protein [Desulfuromonas acetoxidans]NVD24546.1 hypothetical protein [Desulfuromonas acetoxidans]NVE16504.1 hypothetical protein [Desulfuromonas acetoxidans]
MIITESTVQLQAQHQKSQTSVQQETLQFWTTPQTDENTPSPPGKTASRVHLSSAAHNTQQTQAEIVDPLDNEDPLEELDILLLKRLTEMLTGKKITLNHKINVAQNLQKQVTATQLNSQPQGGNRPESFGLVYSYHESYHEQESVNFSAQAQVTTADGRQIDLNVELNMSREFYQETNVNVRAGQALKDPLVINFNGTAAQLTTDKISFDLDLDGQQDQISFVTPGSGFLALDKNSDGIINDGSELFGPTTNDGFSELAAYDNDGNMWIDEQDSIYDRLRIWTRDSDGSQKLLSLGQAGIGAIYLGSTSTPFSLTDSSDNSLLGQTRETGIFLHEDGRAGTIQELDLVI